jgi:DNA-binding winged helix-turn-helix (wHTH) protein
MRNSAYEAQDGDGHPVTSDHQEAALHLTLEGLLPANQELVLNLVERTVILFFHAPDGKVTKVEEKRFSPNGMRVLVPLLQAYPKYCHHEVLFASLYSLPLEQAYQQMREMHELTIRSVRRAISSLHARLRAFGWQVRSIHGVGYLIEAIPAEQV